MCGSCPRLPPPTTFRLRITDVPPNKVNGGAHCYQGVNSARRKSKYHEIPVRRGPDPAGENQRINGRINPAPPLTTSAHCASAPRDPNHRTRNSTVLVLAQNRQ